MKPLIYILFVSPLLPAGLLPVRSEPVTLDWHGVSLPATASVRTAALANNLVILAGAVEDQPSAWVAAQTPGPLMPAPLTVPPETLFSAWTWQPEISSLAVKWNVDGTVVFLAAGSSGIRILTPDATAANALESPLFLWRWDTSRQLRTTQSGSLTWTVDSYGSGSGSYALPLEAANPCFLHWADSFRDEALLLNDDTDELFAYVDRRGIVATKDDPRPRLLMVSPGSYSVDGGLSAQPYLDDDGRVFQEQFGDEFGDTILVVDTNGTMHAAETGGVFHRVVSPEPLRLAWMDPDSRFVVAVASSGAVWSGFLPPLPRGLQIRITNEADVITAILTAAPGGSYRFATSTDLQNWTPGSASVVPATGELSFALPTTASRFYVRAEGPLP